MSFLDFGAGSGVKFTHLIRRCLDCDLSDVMQFGPLEVKRIERSFGARCRFSLIRVCGCFQLKQQKHHLAGWSRKTDMQRKFRFF